MSQDNTPLRYLIRFVEPHAHRIEVTLEIPDRDRQPSLELWMPVWTPGSYLVREFSRNVERFEAKSASGGPLPWRKTAKNRWEIDREGAGPVTVTYRVYGRELSVRTNWIEDGLAFLTGAATFLTVRGFESSPHHVTVELPPGWEDAWSAMDPDPAREAETGLPRLRAFLARDHDELVDSPLLAGSPPRHGFDVDGVPVTVLHAGDMGGWDGDAATAHMQTLVEECRDLYGALPLRKYLFLNLILEGKGGLEHKNSSVLMTSRNTYRNREAYVDWLGLVAHEFFHVWNVKRSRPAALGPFDYEQEAYTRSLWVAEGTTAYYTDLIPRRAGLTTDVEYLKELSKLVAYVQASPGRFEQSLEEASFDAWIKLYRADENTSNSTVSYYMKGAVAAWFLDVEIRRATGGQRSLDDVMRLLFERHAGERGFTDEDVTAAITGMGGNSIGPLLDRVVRGREELDYAPALAYLGLRFRDPREGVSPDTPPTWLGIGTRSTGGRLLVTTVRADGPARQGGLNVDDELLGVGGRRVTKETLASSLGQHEPRERVELLVARRGTIRIVPVVLGKHPGLPWRLEIDPGASPEAVQARAAWLAPAATPPPTQKR